MYYIKKCFFLFFIISAMYIGLTFIFLEDSSNNLNFMVFAMDDNSISISSFPISSNLQDQQKSDEIAYNSSKFIQTAEEKNECPPKPTSLEMDPRISESLEPDTDPGSPIRIKVPTLASTGRDLLIEGTGFIPLEQVRVELSIDWTSSSPEVKDQIFIQCKIVVANNVGSFETILELPEMPFPTKGIGKYSIIGMESRQEKTAIGSFSTSKIGFSFRQ